MATTTLSPKKTSRVQFRIHYHHFSPRLSDTTFFARCLVGSVWCFYVANILVDLVNQRIQSSSQAELIPYSLLSVREWGHWAGIKRNKGSVVVAT